MNTPTPDPVNPEELPALAAKTMEEAKFPLFATVDGDQPRLRPMSPVRTDGFTVYLANLKRYGKTDELAANPKVELCWFAPSHDQVRITGVAETVTDETLLQQIWDANPLLQKYMGKADNPELIVYRIVPSRVRFMREWALDYHEVPLG